jgi:hypothetical protein
MENQYSFSLKAKKSLAKPLINSDFGMRSKSNKEEKDI